MSTTLPYKKYDQARSLEFQRRLVEEVKRMPGVEAATAADHLPLQAILFPYYLRVPDREEAEAMARHVDPSYRRVLRIPLLARSRSGRRR